MAEVINKQLSFQFGTVTSDLLESLRMKPQEPARRVEGQLGNGTLVSKNNERPQVPGSPALKEMTMRRLKDNKLFAEFEEKIRAKQRGLESTERIVIKKSGLSAIIPISKRSSKKRERRLRQEILDKCVIGPWGPSVASTSIGGGPVPSRIEESNCPKWPLNKSLSQKKQKSQPQRVYSNTSVNNRLLNNITKLIKTKPGMTLEIIHKRSTRLNMQQVRDRKYLCARVRHMDHQYKKRDLHSCDFTDDILRHMVQGTSGRLKHNTNLIRRGWSGFVLTAANLSGKTSNSKNGLFIVRGQYMGKLYDARVKVTAHARDTMDYYSSAGVEFWKGFDETFCKYREEDRDHTCATSLNVRECGSVSAIMCQALFPCGKITCMQCVQDTLNEEGQANKEKLKAKVKRAKEHLMQNFPKFKHSIIVLERYESALTNVNDNYAAFAEIQGITAGRNTAAFTHANKLNEILIKGASASRKEFSDATNHLLEISRYMKNRTENIETGSLKFFRNKISQKAHVNTTLMCDNQLDKNGNFVWGERAYHARRFFENFFEIIDPVQGYAQYENREFPNGTRKLAIGRLIVSTNFSTLREQMKGEPIEAEPIGKECVSMMGKDFVYSCCCVTTEQGEPLLSDIKMPTKHHLVIGNSGDSKYVDLPAQAENKMYIAKKGYCYMNVFLAMLVNVDESEAKSFTKMVRDVIVPKLDTWPTLLDLATACHLLKIFYPSVGNAELPRILVDHKTKTMHVIDSFGSITTGYHILKANTVEQLIKFTGHLLQSEMKFYRVGGDVLDEYSTGVELGDPNWHLQLLIKGIYKPAILHRTLMWNRYLLVYAMLSPSVLLALYNSGSLEELTKRYLRKDNNFVVLITLLESLAVKVSNANSVLAQVRIIEKEAPIAIEAVQGIKQRHAIPYNTALHMLVAMAERNKTDGSLEQEGFVVLRTSSIEVLEKSYQQSLQDQWNGLSWWEASCARWRSSKHVIYTRRNSTHFVTADSNDKFGESIIAFSNRTFKASLRPFKTCGRLITEKIQKVQKRSVRALYSVVNYMVPDIIKFINILVVLSLILSITKQSHEFLKDYRDTKLMNQQVSDDRMKEMLELHYKLTAAKVKGQPTKEEFVAHLEESAPDLLRTFEQQEKEVEHQARKGPEQTLERIVAFLALIFMMFDAERSDCVARTLTKLKTLVASADPPVHHQSLDDIEDELTERKFVIDFEMAQSDSPVSSCRTEKTFGEWWSHQLEKGFVIPHYRTEGFFMTFTRATAASVANEIANSSEHDIMLMGAVGSGKSTGLPFSLAKQGSVLLLEPTRPLAENVHRQLGKEPFYCNTTLKMRGVTVFGASPITIMTSGYALNYYARNRSRINEFDFIIFDECHVHDHNAMAMRCLLAGENFNGKIIKVSATPPGREPTFTTQFPVKVNVAESLTFQDFVSAQGSNANVDVIQHAANILVYVASYNEVDILSSLLLEKGFKVTKVDGRTMKVGGVEIATSGTSSKPHFVVATNIIENGVTLDIEAVVDFGTKVIPYLDVDSRMLSYHKVSVSYGERIQRLGRVGRHKEGFALRIGHTEKGLSEVPSCIATEAAFKCFTFGLPVIANNVSTNLLASATVRQARTMEHFELSPFYTVNLVRYDGSMHPAVHALLRKYKLHDSEIVLNSLAIPNKGLGNWLTAQEYAKLGCNIEADRKVRIPFMCKEIPEKLHIEMWETIQKYKGDAGFGRLTSASACRIAYTLQTDLAAIQRTVKIIDTLIASERQKQEYFNTITAHTVSTSNFSLLGITNAIKARYADNHTVENISKLEAARAQLLEFQNLSADATLNALNGTVAQNYIRDFGALESVHHQSADEISKHLKLKGRWNKSLVTRDVLVMLGVLSGGIWMIIQHFFDSFNEVKHEAKGKRQKQKLRFRQARDSKVGREVFGDDETIEYYFGDAYTKKGKTSGRKRGMGVKNRRFINMYGFDPEDFSAVRYVDPLTGATLDEAPLVDVSLIQEYFTKVRNDMVSEDTLEAQLITAKPGIEAYFMNKKSNKALKVDLLPHNSLYLCDKTNNIAGFPEREYELRQVGEAKPIELSKVPDAFANTAAVNHESTSLYRGLRDYTPIASSICHLTNRSEGHSNSLYGIGYGALLLTNRHLFERNNGELLIKTRHGEFLVKNTTQLQLCPVPDRDLILIKLPKDVPPFPQRLTFRAPKNDEQVCLVGANYQTKCITSLVSATSPTFPVHNSHFWKHWISTKDGQCGSPIVSTIDGSILGLHSLANFANSINYFACFPPNFKEEFLDTPEQMEWVKHWKYNTASISWGSLNIRSAQPKGMFNPEKLILDLNETAVYTQMERNHWLFDKLEGNLKAMAYCPSQLVTKHTVKGKCQMFDLYLNLHEAEREYFAPLLGKYQKSRLNREAYIKDIMKYSTVIEVGIVDSKLFEEAVNGVIGIFEGLGFETCNYILNEEDIFSALNMKAAVGALYKGKKKDYFDGYTQTMKEEILRESCERLYTGQMGVWNGSLKAELRPLEKVEANKTRTFTAAPIDTLLGGKACVDDFNNQFYDLNLKAPWSVGMTKFYGGWNTLLSSLPDGWIHCDADGSQFDSSLSPYLINAVLNIRLHFMENWDIGEQMLRNLYTEIVYTPISTPDGTLVKKYKGNNSGQPSTVVDNTIMVIIAVTYSLLKSGIPKELHSEMSKFFVNGDDLLLSVKPEYEYVLDSMAQHFTELGLKYTFDTRTKNKEELWFMSHKGIRREGIWIPKLEEERIVSILEWDRSKEPSHRLEAICAAMIESWGYDKLTHEIRKFYQWLLGQAPYSGLANEGKAPYIAECALRKLYLNKEVMQDDIMRYLNAIFEDYEETEDAEVFHQASKEQIDAGLDPSRETKNKNRENKDREDEVKKSKEPAQTGKEITPSGSSGVRDKDINAGTEGTISVPKIKSITSNMQLPKHKGQSALNLTHLLGYKPRQVDISNTRATQEQFDAWFEGVKGDYGLRDDEMQVVLNGLMVWCIENGTSPNINGKWVMMDGEEQVTFPIKPLIDHAKPTFRQIMSHFSNVAEAYIEMRNQKEPYMPRYGLQRNLTDMSLARFAFDFYEVTPKTPIRAREAIHQMKAAALRNAKNVMFGLDGNVSNTDENTERHTTDDVNRNMHSLLGVRNM